MPKLDLSKLSVPTLDITMLDENQTTIRVSTPTAGLIEDLQNLVPQLQGIMDRRDTDALHTCYHLASELINNNRSFIRVTPEELQNTYGMGIAELIAFFNAYIDFIAEITNSKN